MSGNLEEEEVGEGGEGQGEEGEGRREEMGGGGEGRRSCYCSSPQEPVFQVVSALTTPPPAPAPFPRTGFTLCSQLSPPVINHDANERTLGLDSASLQSVHHSGVGGAPWTEHLSGFLLPS